MEAPDRKAAQDAANAAVLAKLHDLYSEAFVHNGFAEIKVEMRILRHGQKEVILHCGKQYRYVIDYRPANPLEWEFRREKLAEVTEITLKTERRRRQEAIAFPDRRRRNKVKQT